MRRDTIAAWLKWQLLKTEKNKKKDDNPSLDGKPAELDILVDDDKSEHNVLVADKNN